MSITVDPGPTAAATAVAPAARMTSIKIRKSCKAMSQIKDPGVTAFLFAGWPTQACFWLEWDTRLLPLSPPVTARHGRCQAHLRGRPGARPPQLWTVRLWLRCHARTRSPAAGGTAVREPCRRDQVVEVGCFPAIDRHRRTLLAKALLRLQHPKLSAVCRETALHPSQPGEVRTCAAPEGWAWSSFRHYASEEEGQVEIESEWTARKRERAPGRLCAAVPLPHSSQKQA
jgi:hypothetical protein